MWQGRTKGPESSQSWPPILLGVLLLLHLPLLAQQPAQRAARALPWVHTTLGTGCAASSCPVCRQRGGFIPSFLTPCSDFVSLPPRPTWYRVDIIPLLVWLCTSSARRNLGCANLVCTSSHLPASRCEPTAAPSPSLNSLSLHSLRTAELRDDKTPHPETVQA